MLRGKRVPWNSSYSAFDSCLKETGFNSAEAGHCVTTVGKLSTPTVPSGAKSRLNQLTRGIAGISLATGGNSLSALAQVYSAFRP